MADNTQNPGAVTNTFSKGMVKDYNETFVGEGLWTHARNSVNASHDGQIGVIGNEPSNLYCVTLPYDLVGSIHLTDDQWAIFTTDDKNCEIGIFDESACSYKTVVNDHTLNFKRSNLITGVYRKRYDCERLIYWDDGLNPTRVMDLDNPPKVCFDANKYEGKIKKFTIKAATCSNGTAGSIIRYRDHNNIDQEKWLKDGEVFDFLTADASATDVKDLACDIDLCNEYTISVTTGTGSTTSYKRCMTAQQAYDLQFPKGDLNEQVSIHKTDVECNCNNAQNIVTNPSILSEVKIDKSANKDCINLICTNRVDVEKIRLAVHMKQPILEVTRGKSAGTLPNGSYQVCMAYTVNENKVTDYIGLSNIQSLFTHENTNGSLDVTIKQIDTVQFVEFELVIISTVNAQTVAKRLGFYSTGSGIIHIDNISPELVTIPLSLIPLRTEPIEKSDAMYSVNNYLLRVGVYSKYQFNYQPQANRIMTKWAAVEYSSDYYDKGGNHVGYLRDEQYAFFIRWVYNTGEKTASFHIPGRAPSVAEQQFVYAGDAFETLEGQQVKRWQVENTAGIESVTPQSLPDGGRVIATGVMGYWESTERYPADRPDIWDNLCGKPIRHHKMPDVTVDKMINHFTEDGAKIVVLGVQFENITHPLDYNGQKIASIVGYEILRGSREGQKTVIAKGMFNNLRTFDLPGNTTIKGLFQNYPFNDLRPDYYLTSNETVAKSGFVSANLSEPLKGYKKDYFSFHSPDTSFTKPYLSAGEVKIYEEIYGNSEGKFSVPYKHPKFKVLTNFSGTFASILSVITTVGSFVAAVAQDSNITLQGTEDLPYTKKLTLTKVPNFAVGGGGSFLGTGGSVMLPNPVIVAYNAAIGAYNLAVTIAMSYIEAQSTAEQLFNIIRGLVPRKQYALQYDSHGYYNKFLPAIQDNRRRKLEKAGYIRTNIHGFDGTYQINNLYRPNFVAVKLGRELNDPVNRDTSRFRIGEKGGKINSVVSGTVSGLYGAIKVALASQYGQLDSIKQVPISGKVHSIDLTDSRYASDIIFGGDTYIGRFTEKNSFPLYNAWLSGEPDEYEYDYRNYWNVAYPRFWINSEKQNYKLFSSASETRHFDERKSDLFFVSQGYFYLFVNGVRDFFCESEVNLAQRDFEEDIPKRHFDVHQYADYQSLFRADYIKYGNYYKYDYSLSPSKLYNTYISWGQMYPRDYSPVVAQKCYVYRPNRVIYSLPQQEEGKKDNWRVFLANNYKDFQSKVTAIKSVNKTGALFMMKYQSPVQFMGVDSLQSDNGTKLTVGDGGLFQQPLQAIVNSDDSYEYGSCQGRFATVGTTHGIFWVSQNQGKIFQYAGGLNEISRDGMKYWFAKYLPSELLKVYPDYPLDDNPLKGIGVQMIYDNTFEILYVCKRDYKPKMKDLQYDDGGFFKMVNGAKTYYAFDSEAFENASWTASYDPKNKMWISFHDWIPTFLLPGKAHFMSVNANTIWKHNQRTDSYCNFYNTPFAWEIEFVSSTGQQVNSIRNIEYMLEAYKYHNDGKDKYHVLDENFNHAIVYNSEQISGMLTLELKPKNNPSWLLDYPKVGVNDITIHYSKEEQKYRFNQFWDTTKDRGEFIWQNVPMWVTKANGYDRSINREYIDYSKSPLEHKRFRHNVNRVWLRRSLSKDIKFLFKISNQKIHASQR